VMCSRCSVARPSPPSSSAYSSLPIRKTPTSSRRDRARQDALSRRLYTTQLGDDAPSQAREGASELQHAGELRAVSVLAAL